MTCQFSCETYYPQEFDHYLQLRWSAVIVGDLILLAHEPMRVTSFFYQRRDIIIGLSSMTDKHRQKVDYTIPC